MRERKNTLSVAKIKYLSASDEGMRKERWCNDSDRKRLTWWDANMFQCHRQSCAPWWYGDLWKRSLLSVDTGDWLKKTFPKKGNVLVCSHWGMTQENFSKKGKFSCLFTMGTLSSEPLQRRHASLTARPKITHMLRDSGVCVFWLAFTYFICKHLAAVWPQYVLFVSGNMSLVLAVHTAVFLWTGV